MAAQATTPQRPSRVSRQFNTGDDVTDRNLGRLDHLAGCDWFDGSSEHMHTWLCATIQTIDMLPKLVERHFWKGRYQIGDWHFHVAKDAIDRKWRELVAGLNGELDAVAADTTLLRENEPDLSDRPQSRGERIVAVCDQLSDAFRDGLDTGRLAARLEEETRGTEASSDAAELGRLLKRKRIPDYRDYRYRVVSLIYHAKMIGDRLSYMR